MPWWDLDLTNQFNLPQADKGSAPAGFFDSSSGAVRIFYIASKTIRHGYFAGSTWGNQNISGPGVAAGTALCAFADSVGNHIVYDAAVSRSLPQVHQILGTSSGATWVDQDLNPNAAVAVASGLSSFVDGNGGAHVFYIRSTDQHVHQLSYSNGAWTDQDLTSLAGGPSAVTPSPLVSYSDGYGYHIFYVSDQHVHQLFLGSANSAKWVDQDLTATTNGPQVAPGSGLSGFVDSYGEHAFYVGSDQYLHHLIFTSGNWSDHGLTALTTTTTTAATASAVSSFGDSYGDHAVYVGADQHVHQLYFDNSVWSDQDLTSTATPVVESQVPQAANGSSLASLADAYGEQIF